MSKIDSLHNTVTRLQEFLQDQGAPKATEVTSGFVRRAALEGNYPDPELAARVARFLAKRVNKKGQVFSFDDVSEAVLTMLLSDEISGSPLVSMREAVMSASRRLGDESLDLHAAVMPTGFGYRHCFTVADRLGDCFESAA